jgi:hypothetical protein
MFQFRTFSGLTEGTLSVCQGSPHGEISLEDASPRRVSAPPRQSYTHTGCTFRPTSSTRIAKCLRRLKSDPSLRNLREWNSNPKFPKNHRARSEPRLFNPSSHSENTQPEMVADDFFTDSDIVTFCTSEICRVHQILFFPHGAKSYLYMGVFGISTENAWTAEFQNRGWTTGRQSCPEMSHATENTFDNFNGTDGESRRYGSVKPFESRSWNED